jgi:hypothetical protein
MSLVSSIKKLVQSLNSRAHSDKLKAERYKVFAYAKVQRLMVNTLPRRELQ